VTVYTLMRGGWPTEHGAVQYLADPDDAELERGDVVIVSGAMGFPDRWSHLRSARVLQRRVPGLGIVVSDATWHPRSSSDESKGQRLRPVLTVIEKWLLRSLDPSRTRYCFLSDDERLSFAREAKVPLDTVRVTPFFPTIVLEPDLDRLLELAADPQPYVFSGGNATRDYDLLRRALGGTDIEVRIATRATAPDPPPNFVEGPVGHDDFLHLLACAAIVVIPLATTSGRSAGQQSYLNAMRLGKPTIVNDAIGVIELLGDAAFIVPSGDPDALRAKIEWILRPENADQVAEVVERGRRLTTEELTSDHYLGQLASIAFELASAISPRGR
jgi:glycosyltransferase involved in cell wall biosynthesis